jgi:hypothetical protein
MGMAIEKDVNKGKRKKKKIEKSIFTKNKVQTQKKRGNFFDNTYFLHTVNDTLFLYILTTKIYAGCYQENYENWKDYLTHGAYDTVKKVYNLGVSEDTNRT